jgi:hypothetical protein
MKGKKDKEAKSSQDLGVQDTAVFGQVTTREDLKAFLHSLVDRMSANEVAPFYALIAMNHVMNLKEFYSLLDKESKELARDIWLRIKTAGLQVANPPVLFGADEDGRAS